MIVSFQQMPTIMDSLYLLGGPLWSWSYGSWIYNYLCNQCLSSLKLWVWTPFMAMCTPVFFTNKTVHRNITEILLKAALNTINQPSQQSVLVTNWFPKSYLKKNGAIFVLWRNLHLFDPLSGHQCYILRISMIFLSQSPTYSNYNAYSLWLSGQLSKYKKLTSPF